MGEIELTCLAIPDYDRSRIRERRAGRECEARRRKASREYSRPLAYRG